MVENTQTHPHTSHVLTSHDSRLTPHVLTILRVQIFQNFAPADKTFRQHHPLLIVDIAGIKSSIKTPAFQSHHSIDLIKQDDLPEEAGVDFCACFQYVQHKRKPTMKRMHVYYLIFKSIES
jgi:hypothetical protein